MDVTHTEPAPAWLAHTIASADDASASATPSWLQLFPPRAIEWNRLDLAIPNLPAGFHGLRILHISDAHLRRHWPRAYDLLLERIRHDPPDLLLFTGDFVDNKRNYHPAMINVRRMVEGFKARLGCFAIHGNHDSYDIGRELSNTSVTFLDGQRFELKTPAGPIELLGLPGKHRNELTEKVIRSFPPRKTGMPRIVLSHYPDHVNSIAALRPDLVVAGHTHGGQICLTNGAAILWHDALPRRLAQGAHRIGDSWLVVSRGLGWTGLPIRAFCTPEVVEIRLIAGT